MATAYQRKTRDVYTLHGNYGQGWEELTAELTRKEIQARCKEYRENDSQPASYKITVKREKI